MYRHIYFNLPNNYLDDLFFNLSISSCNADNLILTFGKSPTFVELVPKEDLYFSDGFSKNFGAQFAKSSTSPFFIFSLNLLISEPKQIVDKTDVVVCLYFLAISIIFDIAYCYF